MSPQALDQSDGREPRHRHAAAQLRAHPRRIPVHGDDPPDDWSLGLGLGRANHQPRPCRDAAPRRHASWVVKEGGAANQARNQRAGDARRARPRWVSEAISAIYTHFVGLYCHWPLGGSRELANCRSYRLREPVRGCDHPSPFLASPQNELGDQKSI